MKLHLLRLRGFCGIRDGLGRNELILDLDRLAEGAALVALAGANGRGKTMVLDNLHPFLTMPSRAGAASAGGFSYYEHVYLPESEKELVWSLAGCRYRSQVVIRNNGRRRTEAFLFVWEQEQWVPVVVDDAVSDGKVETYTRCVESLCGSAETFFTSAFSAQGQRQLSHYRNGEIKSLLADLLGQDEIRQWGQRAGETVRLLKTGLAVLRQTMAGVERDAAQLAQDRQRLAEAPEQVARCATHREEMAVALQAEQERHAACLAERQQAEGGQRRRAQLQADRASTIAQGKATLAALEAQDQCEAAREQALQQRAEQRVAQAHARRQELQRPIDRLRGVLCAAPAVQRAVSRLALAERIEGLREAGVDDAQRMLQECRAVRQALATNRQRLADVEQAAGQAVLKAEDLCRRFGLTAQVPCAGTKLQGRCQLLGDAHQAQALIPSAQGQVRRLAAERQTLETEHADLALRLDALAPASELLAWAEYCRDRSRARTRKMAALAARVTELTRAQVSLAEAEQALAALAPAQDEVQPEETAERERITAARYAIAAQRTQQAGHYRQMLDGVERTLGALPPPWPQERIVQSEAMVERARVAAEAAVHTHLAAVKDAQTREALDHQARACALHRRELRGRIGRVEEALGAWNLFARCMGNDGLIALAIDDAGPALAGLANELLLACYGPRFTLSIHTLVNTAKGEAREGFEIEIHDADTGSSKPVALASGGERVWINACLTRAVALHLAQQGGRRYATLFSDEADGALDSERKRMWMTMKREVLRLGGYEREYFISQTPELAAMADAVIDLDAMRLGTLGTGVRSGAIEPLPAGID